jgi:hypothetical protein
MRGREWVALVWVADAACLEAMKLRITWVIKFHSKV